MAMLERAVVVMVSVMLTWLPFGVDRGVAQHGRGRKRKEPGDMRQERLLWQERRSGRNSSAGSSTGGLYCCTEGASWSLHTYLGRIRMAMDGTTSPSLLGECAGKW